MIRFIRHWMFHLQCNFRKRNAEKARRFDLIMDVMDDICDDWIYKHGNSCDYPCPFHAICSHMTALNGFGRSCSITRDGFKAHITNSMITAIDEHGVNITINDEFDYKL